MRAALLAMGLGLGATGCAGYRVAGAGVWHGVGEGAHGPGVAVDLEQAQSFGAAARGSYLMWSLGVHGKFAASRVQVAPTLSVRLMRVRRWLMPFGGLGLRAFQVESIDGAAGFGMFSPVADAGLMLRIPGGAEDTAVESVRVVRGWAVVLRAAAGYDLRFTAQPHEPWVSATLGFGTMFGAY